MSRVIPVDSRTADWPRKVAGQVNDGTRRIDQMRLLYGISRAKLKFLYG